MSQNSKPARQECVDLVSAGEEDIENVEDEQARINQNYLEDLHEVELHLEEEAPRPVGRASGAVAVGQARRRMMRHYLEFQEAIAPGAPIKPRRVRAPSPPPRPRKKIYRLLDLVDPDDE